MVAQQYWAVLLFYVYVANCSRIEEATTKSAEPEAGASVNAERQVSILKRINRVNSDGSYTYGYEAVDGSFKIETRDVAGNVKGVFGYVDEAGRIKRVSYATKNGTEYQSGHLIVPENETVSTVSTLSSPLNHQQITRPQITSVASASTTTESLIQSRRPVFRPANPRTTTEPTTTSGSKISDQVTRKLYPVYNANQHLSAKNKSFDEQTNPKLVSNRTMLKKELTNTSATDSTAHSSMARRPVHTVYGQYIRQPFTHLHRMQNHSTVNNSNKEFSNTPLNVQAQLYDDLIQALDDTADTTPVFSTSSRSFGSRTNSDDVDRSDVSSLETDGSQSAIEHVYFRQTRRNSSGNGLRRQLTDINGDLSASLAFPHSKSHVTGTDDSLDVYGGSTPATTPRPIPSFAFRPYGVGSSKPRTIEDAILQNPYAATPGVVTDPTIPEDTVQKLPPGRIPYENFRPGDFRRIYVTQQDDYDGNYYYQQYDMRNLLAQLTQLLIYQLQQNYNTRLTPAQIALISMLGIDIPPGLVQNSFYPPTSLIPRRQGYPQEQSPYSPVDDTLYVTNEDPRLFARRRPVYRPRPQFVTPPPQPFPYDSRQAGRDDPRVPYTPTPGLQVFLPRYYPQQPLPYNSPEVQYSQGGRSSGRTSHVAMPQEILPDEYRDAVFLRMLLAARAQQAPPTKGLPQQFPAGAEPSPLPGYATGRPLRGQPEHQQSAGTVLVRPRPVFVPQESASSSSSTTTGRPRTLAPTRSVQILDPVTEEPTVKRSTDNSTSSTVQAS